ncbi:phage protein Gp27 family protein [Pseudosulfitobacter pseudonitzschiae]|uniref:phage protein Gp27 family protein n=1 Tax=Pseudosulfitobacter pseudonitzschiae TaxID=1402135 RepID=UPI001AFA6981|nr:phage protein Gp27 family protein [Pseudosulfitobacter pseudonitzschiae]MBM1816246.1 DUF3486 family protein [Pseudosulfitobacter pseudonitzschiae]MBM1833745.1 DUF3486 family protein [Pseudosulfitobacter pseudonitzschiae]MBM1838611.1 DUF3486 family protein [Pseudosulfitobacter pseudonitzschiae]MBM1842959.1 DUF3486 family protein [Pseudosulfitobacter pseudonitzschiae]MBM1847825.1 DUF3486 family protein [Pseudosulfitobacter pseudonitzschiae]
MPPPRKVDLLPEEQKTWLKDALKAGGFAGYEQLADDLNTRLEAAGITLRIGKSALHTFGKEYSEFVRYQEEASAWAADWMKDNGLEEEAQRHNVLFQMITTLAFKVMQHQMTQTGENISPQELHFLGRMLKDVMSSSGIRQKLLADERKRVAEEATRAERDRVAVAMDGAIAEAGLSAELASDLRAKVLGVSR